MRYYPEESCNSVMVQTHDQLAFWATDSRELVSDDWPVLRSAGWSSQTFREEIAVPHQWTSPATRVSAQNIFLFVSSANWIKRKWSVDEVLANAAPAAIAALIRIGFAQSETLSLDRFSVQERAVKQLIARDVELGRWTRIHAGSLADSYMRISQEVFRNDVDTAWMRAIARVSHHEEKARSTPDVQERTDQFISSAHLINIARDGLRSHSANCARLIEPRFMETALAHLDDEDINKFIAIRMWRLMLSLADHAAAGGKREVRLGNKSGFLDEVDHLILDRIPVTPKAVTLFLNLLYEEYGHFARPGLSLPQRGKLWSNEDGLFLQIEGSAEPIGKEERGDQKTEVRFE
jgi:hypothetical protein